MQTWKPDTCNCALVYDGKTSEIDVFTTKRCEDHSELDTKTELLPFVIAENQSANELYVKWTEEEINDNFAFIKQYKKSFKNLEILDPIRDLTPANAKLAFQAVLSLREV